MVIASFTAVASEMFGCCFTSQAVISVGVHLVFPHSLCSVSNNSHSFSLYLICLISFSVFEVHRPSIDDTPGLSVLGAKES